MFTDRRQLMLEDFVGFGASEVMMTGLDKGLLDTTVTVCEGAGTVISNNLPLSRELAVGCPNLRNRAYRRYHQNKMAV
jgi:hypothetical protein